MKKYFLFWMMALLALPTLAQVREEVAPKWTNKAMKSIVSVLAYDKNNELLHNGTGVVVDNDIVVCDYNLLREAYSAKVSDTSGNLIDVERILGADSNYGLVKMLLKGKKLTPVAIGGSTASSVGAQTYAIAFSKNKLVSCPAATITKKDIVEEKYAYFTLSTAFEDKYTNAALFNANGECLGIVQSPIAGKSYAIDINYGKNLSIAPILDKAGAVAMNNIFIKKGLPETMEESLVYLYIKSKSAGNDEYLDLLNLFISKYPDNAEGYYRRSTVYQDLLKFDEANEDLMTYLRYAQDKMVANSNVASAIYTKLLYQPQAPYEKWSYDLALEYIDKALAEAGQRQSNAKTDDEKEQAEVTLTQYKLQKAQILIAKRDDAQAIALYQEVNRGPFRSASTILAECLAHEAAGDSVSVMIELMDSAIATFPEPMPKEAANFVMRRAKYYEMAKHFRKAVQDYNTYCYLNNNQVQDRFYYDRALLEVQARMFQQAIEDIDHAIDMAPNVALYHVEKSGIMLRVNRVDDCIASAQKAIALNPELPDAYRIMGYAQAEQGKKAEGIKNLEKAVSLGDEAAKEILERYK